MWPDILKLNSIELIEEFGILASYDKFQKKYTVYPTLNLYLTI
jgi:hypothetical protein